MGGRESICGGIGGAIEHFHVKDFSLSLSFSSWMALGNARGFSFLSAVTEFIIGAWFLNLLICLPTPYVSPVHLGLVGSLKHSKSQTNLRANRVHLGCYLPYLALFAAACTSYGQTSEHLTSPPTSLLHQFPPIPLPLKSMKSHIKLTLSSG